MRIGNFWRHDPQDKHKVPWVRCELHFKQCESRAVCYEWMPHSLTLFPLHRVTLVHPLQNCLRSNPSAAQAPQIRTLTAKSWPLDNLYGLSHVSLNFIRWISTHLTCCCFTGLHCCRYSTRCSGLYFTVCPERDNGRNMLDYHRYKIWWKCYRLFLVESWDLLRSLCREVCRQVLDISHG